MLYNLLKGVGTCSKDKNRDLYASLPQLNTLYRMCNSKVICSGLLHLGCKLNGTVSVRVGLD